MNNELLDNALSAIQRFFNDTRVPDEVTHDGLEDIQKLVSDLMNTLTVSYR